MKAHQLKIQCLKSDKLFQSTAREYYEYYDNLNILRSQLKNEENINAMDKEPTDDLIQVVAKSNSSSDEDYEEAFQFLEKIVNMDNSKLLNKITEITNHSEERESYDCKTIPEVEKKYDETPSFLDSLEISLKQLKGLTDQIIEILPPQPSQHKPLTLRINLRSLRSSNRVKLTPNPIMPERRKKISKTTKKNKNKTFTMSRNICLPKKLACSNLAKLRPRTNSIF